MKGIATNAARGALEIAGITSAASLCAEFASVDCGIRVDSDLREKCSDAALIRTTDDRDSCYELEACSKCQSCNTSNGYRAYLARIPSKRARSVNLPTPSSV